MFYSFFFCLTEEHVRIRFMFSTSFHEFVPKQRLTEWEWFGYLEVRIKTSCGGCLVNGENEVSGQEQRNGGT